MLVQGFKSAFLPFREKQDLLRAVNAEIAEVLARFTGPRRGRAGAAAPRPRRRAARRCAYDVARDRAPPLPQPARRRSRVEAGDEGVFGLSFARPRARARPGVSARARAHLDAAVEALDAYFAGRPPRLPALDLRGTPFQLAVWDALRAHPVGRGPHLRRDRAPPRARRAARARSAARTTRTRSRSSSPATAWSRRAGGSAATPAGSDVKRWLLAHEAAHAPALRARRAHPDRAPRRAGARVARERARAAHRFLAPPRAGA